jgi:diguanylate cyclase (GGDEF)-like protein
VSIENVDLHETISMQAVTDELTGLYNLRHFHDSLDTELERSRRFGTNVGLVMLDIDDFKRINDTFGHQQGDLVLIEVARVLRNLSRDIDEPARYGGEEMAVVLPQTDVGGAELLAERMRAAVEELAIDRLDGKGPLTVTASFGVASLPQSARDKASLIAEADAALYRAKRAGKNRVGRAEPVTAES